MSTQPTRLNGRDEDGFAIGSNAARSLRRYGVDGERCPDHRNELRRARRAAQVDPDELRRRLIAPADAGAKVRRRLARQARDAARALGVDVPDWAEPSLTALRRSER